MGLGDGIISIELSDEERKHRYDVGWDGTIEYSPGQEFVESVKGVTGKLGLHSLE